jgi:hypothetical protein
MNSVRRIAERAQDQIELGLELRDSSELNAELSFGIGKPLVYGVQRQGRRAASNLPLTRGCCRGGKCMCHGTLRYSRAYARGEMPAVLNGTPGTRLQDELTSSKKHESRVQFSTPPVPRSQILSRQVHVMNNEGRNGAEHFRRLAEEARDVRDHHRDALEAIREERERLRETAETARIASEQGRMAGEAARTASEAARAVSDGARHAVVEAVRATADALNASLEKMQVVEDMRRVLREIRDVKTLDSN